MSSGKVRFCIVNLEFGETFNCTFCTVFAIQETSSARQQTNCKDDSRDLPDIEWYWHDSVQYNYVWKEDENGDDRSPCRRLFTVSPSCAHRAARNKILPWKVALKLEPNEGLPNASTDCAYQAETGEKDENLTEQWNNRISNKIRQMHPKRQNSFCFSSQMHSKNKLLILEIKSITWFGKFHRRLGYQN